MIPAVFGLSGVLDGEGILVLFVFCGFFCIENSDNDRTSFFSSGLF